MVKGYDPSTTDPSKILLQYLLRWSTTANPLPIETAQKYTKYWLKNSLSTSQIYSRFNKLQQNQRPQIILRKKCDKNMGWSYWKVFMGKQNLVDENYPAYPQNNNKIVICLNFINNKTQLKENIDRQLMIMWRNNKIQQHQQNQKANSLQQSIKKTTQQQSKDKINPYSTIINNIPITTKPTQQIDKQLIQSLYQGCRQGYKNYELDRQVQQRISKKCAKYLFFRRSQRQLPLDAKFRYASKIIQEVL